MENDEKSQRPIDIRGVGGTAIPKVLLPESAIPYYAIVGNRYCRKPLLCSIRYYPIVLLWIG